MGIIALTVIIRMAMWPLSVSQQRSMKTMQLLQPKMKAIQDRYKSDPQTAQRKMMEFYKEHNFNPMSGCLPMLIQLPIFILLYSSLMSPQFISMAGQSDFLFINRLDATLKGNAGVSNDGKFSATPNDKFSVGKKVKFFAGEEELGEIKLKKNNIEVLGKITPGEPVTMKISRDNLNGDYSQLKKITEIKTVVTDNSTREVEDVTFKSDGDLLIAQVPTVEAKTAFHYDVLILIVIFGITMFLSQKIMTSANKSAQPDPQQEAMQKTMGTMLPVMLTATFLFFPIPAGVLLYLIASNIVMVGQTIVINKQLEKEQGIKKAAKTMPVDNTEIANSKPVKAKEVKNIENETIE